MSMNDLELKSNFATVSDVFNVGDLSVYFLPL